MRKLIVTGDDFGMSLEVNAAIERAHDEGILNTTSLMVGAAAAADAVARARRMPALHVGLHVVLVNGRPCLPAADVPDLVDTQGEFSTHLVRAGVNFFFRPGVRRQLAREIRAQFDAFAATGLVLDHVNAHNHMHTHPTILDLILRIGSDYGVRAVRLPYEPFGPSWRAARDKYAARLWGMLSLAPWVGLMRVRLRSAHVSCNDFVFGLNDTGAMTTQRVLDLVAQLPAGVSEMYFHPATGLDERAMELAALTDRRVADSLHAAGITVTTFSELGGVA